MWVFAVNRNTAQGVIKKSFRNYLHKILLSSPQTHCLNCIVLHFQGTVFDYSLGTLNIKLIYFVCSGFTGIKPGGGFSLRYIQPADRTRYFKEKRGTGRKSLDLYWQISHLFLVIKSEFIICYLLSLETWNSELSWNREPGIWFDLLFSFSGNKIVYLVLYSAPHCFPIFIWEVLRILETNISVSSAFI